MFENFSMSVNIAAGCEATANTWKNYNECGYYFSGKIIFGTDITGCSKESNSIQIPPYSGTNGTEDDSICYHVPALTNNIFNS